MNNPDLLFITDMKIKIIGIGFLLSVFSQSQQAQIKPGAIWYDTQGEQINAHGGGILYDNETYYWYGEFKNDSTGKAMDGVSCYSSTNLTDWKNEGLALEVMPAGSYSDIEQGCILERPKVIYNAQTGKYVMWFHLELKDKGYAAARTGVAISDSPVGPFRFLYAYRPCAGFWPQNFSDEQKACSLTESSFEKWWTPDWMEAVKNGLFTRRDYRGGQMARDMNLFVDADGKAYHIYSSEENLTLHIAELTSDYLGHTGRYIRIFPGGHNEAPALFKKGGTYYMITSGCTGWDPNEARLLTAKSIWGPWTQHPNPCQGDDAKLTFHSQSTFVLPVAGKSDAFIYMGDRWNPRCLIDSRYIWLPIQFENDLPVLRWKDQWTIDSF